MAKKISRWQGNSSKVKKAPDPSSQASKNLKIQNELGLHARAAAQFVKIASRFRSEVTVRRDSQEVNGKSIMGILMLAAAKGTQIQITVRGEDSSETLQALSELVENKFGEK